MHWDLEDIPWHAFDPDKVDPELVKIVKAAAMVESNGADYATYLCNLFADDASFQADARDWAKEEVKHGLALGRWAQLVDPDFDYAECQRRFTAGYRVPLDLDRSVRGSRTGEMIARCIVEVGTSSYYSALAAGAEEPVLKDICRRIAADEFQHYKLFYKTMKRYRRIERVGLLRRLWVALTRIVESEDDELAYAYFAANGDGAYDRKANSRAYIRRTYGYYRRGHIERAVAMTLKAIGLAPTGRLNRTLSNVVCWFMSYRARRLARAEI